MGAVIKALASAIGQLTDPAVLRVLVKSVLVTILGFVLLGLALYSALHWSLAQIGWSSGGLAEAAAAAIVTGIAFWFLFRIIALAVLQFFADEIVAAVERRHYPEQALLACKLPFRRDLANSLRGMGRALMFNIIAAPVALALIFTGIGPALVFLLVNAVLLGRELTDMAWLRRCGDAPSDNPVSGGQRFVLGVAIAGIMIVPIANLFASVIGAAAGTHLVHHVLGSERAGEAGDA